MARIKYVINERRLAYEGAVERFAKDKTLGKIGAVAEQEAAKEKMKGKKTAKPPAAAQVQGRRNTKRRHTRPRTKSFTGEVPTATPSVASPAP
jgi:hypothetical protein